ncbi:AAA family ATPase [Paenibacillus sp. GCM10012303]|uniref:ATP-binding protein n=1 Tax=Paenibacillus sp. GCM10012303 TaxID=3317340 RepID=UPI00361A353E
MNIRGIRLDSFGSLRDRRYELDGPITLFYGPNEAGKSTLMALVRAVLFGQPTRGASADKYEPTLGGAYGGALTLELPDGSVILVERAFQGESGGRGKAASAGRVRLTRLHRGAHHVPASGPSSPAEDEAALRALLGGVQGELFRSVFAFSLTELQELGTLQSEEVAAYLYNAGWGAGGGAILSAERKLAQDMDRLYRPRGKTQELNLLLKRWEQEQADLRRSKESLALYRKWIEELEGADRDIREADEQLRTVRQKAASLERWLRARDHGLRLEAVKRRLGELPPPEKFPHGALSRFEAMRTEQERLLEQRQEAKAKLGQAERAIGAFQPDQALLESRPKLEALLERAGLYRDAKAAIAAQREEAESLGRGVNQALERLDVGWTDAELASYPLSVSDRERLRDAKEQHAQLRGEAELARAEANRASRELEAAERRADQARQELEAAGTGAGAGAGAGAGIGTGIRTGASARSTASGPEALLWEPSAEAMRRKLERLGADYAEWSRLRQEMRHLRQREDDYRRLQMEAPSAAGGRSAGRRQPGGIPGGSLLWLRLVPVVTGVVLSAVLWIRGETVLSVLNLLVFAVISLYAWKLAGASSGERSRSYDRSGNAFLEERAELDRQLAGLERTILERTRSWAVPLISRVAEAAAASADRRPGTAGTGTGTLLPDDWLAEARFAGEVWLQARIELEQRENRYAEAASDAARLREASKAATERLDEAESRLAAWQAEWEGWLGQRGISGGLRPDGAAEWLLVCEQGKQLLLRRDASLRRLADMEAEASAFERETADVCGTASEADPLFELKRRKAEAEKEAAAFAERERLAREAELLRDAIRLIGDKLARVREQIGGLWQEAGAADEQQFRERARLHEEGSLLSREREELLLTLDSMLGKDRRDEALEAMRQPPEELRRELERLGSLQEELERKLDERRDRRGRLRGEMERLESGRDHADKLQRVQETETELRQQMRRWAVHAMAGKLFAHTRKLYETERQPAVLRRASDYMAALTGQRYTRVIAPVGEKRLVAVTGLGEPVDSSKLSRGTAEQLYLAMRFALADETAPSASLPFIMDDVFVNFDADRLRRCLELLPELSARRQLLLFTCHSHVTEAAAAAIPGLQVIRL